METSPVHLKSVNIKGYKNLRATPIRFSGGLVPIALIGNNGSGKSNLIEALTHIFSGLFFDSPPEFDYHVSYVAHGKEVDIQKAGANVSIKVDGEDWSRSKFQKRIREVEARPPFPSLLFGYYSGTCERLKKQFGRYSTSYSRRIQKNDAGLERQFVFADIDQAERVILGLIAHNHRTLLNSVNVRGINEAWLTLTSPPKFDREIDDPRFWGTKGAARDFLADLGDTSEIVNERRVGKDESVDERTYRIDEAGLRRLGVMLEKQSGNLLSMLEFLMKRKMLKRIKFELTHIQSQSKFVYDSLSEGEKQLLAVIGGLTLSMQDECLVLLDEPDTHLNPAWSWEYIDLLRTALEENQQQNSTVLLATHDPIMISGLQRHEVLMATVDEAGKLSYKLPVRDPKGQGIANVLTSEYFGLPSSLDKPTQTKLNRRLELAYKDKLDDDEREELGTINEELKCLGLHISFRDKLYGDYEKQRVEAART